MTKKKTDDEQVNNEFKKGDYVEVVKRQFVGYYAVVTGEGYGDEVEINEFEICDKCWVIQDHDLDCQEKGDFKNIEKKQNGSEIIIFFSQIYFFRTIDDLLILWKMAHKMLGFHHIQISSYDVLQMHVSFIL